MLSSWYCIVLHVRSKGKIPDFFPFLLDGLGRVNVLLFAKTKADGSLLLV